MQEDSEISDGFEHDQSHSHNNSEEPNNNYGPPEDHYYAPNYEQNPNDHHQPQQQPTDQTAPQPSGPTQYSSQSAQISFAFQNNPNRPVQYHQTNPVYVNPVHRPGAYHQGQQTKTIDPPTHSPTYNVGPHYVGQPQKGGGGYQTPGSPMKFSVDNSGPGGYGAMPSYSSGPGPVQMGGPAPGFPVQRPSHGQVHQMVGAEVGTEPWRSGLFDCMNDPSNALITAFCPCITFGQVAEIIDNGHSTCATSGLIYGLAYALAVPCIVSWTYRAKLRKKYGLTETPAPDLVTHILCEWCAVCQVYRELRERGLDPAIGWQGNVARMNLEALQRNQVQMTPPNQERMMA